MASGPVVTTIVQERDLKEIRHLVGVPVHDEALLFKFEASGKACAHIAHMHDTSMIHVEFADDQVAHGTRHLAPLIFLTVCRSQPDDTCRRF